MAADWRSSILGSTTWGKVLIIMSAVVARGRPQVELSSRLTVSPHRPRSPMERHLGCPRVGRCEGERLLELAIFSTAWTIPPESLRSALFLVVYVDPRAGTCASGNGQNRAGWLHAVRLIRLILWVSSSNGVRNKNQPKMTSDGVQATIIPSRNA